MEENSALIKKEILRIIDEADDDVLQKLYAFVKQDLEPDWWDEIGDDQKKKIEDSSQQILAGKGILHEDVKNKYPQWFTG